jgi:hypothetical protein
VSRRDLPALFRRAFLALAALGTGTTALELATLRHWNGFEQVIPWAASGLLGAGVLIVFVASDRGAAAARLIGVVVLIAAGYGLVSHVRANENAGALDRRYETTWRTTSAVTRWWKALSGDVGPSPTFAPAALAFAAFCLAFATVGLGGSTKSRQV